MAPRQTCNHARAKFRGIQKLGQLPPVELWHCPTCKSTVSVSPTSRIARRKPVAAA